MGSTNSLTTKLKFTLNFVLILLLPIAFIVACNNSTSTPGPTASPTTPPITFCVSNVGNFSSVESLSLIGSATGTSWGPNLANLPLPDDLLVCQSEESWNQSRILLATNYWVNQKVNYCHHHVPTWYPYDESSFAVCSLDTDIMAPVPSESMVRWNYSGTGTESALAWYNYRPSLGYATGNYGYGLDCSDYSKLIYSYAESIVFTSGINLQAGQSTDESSLAPNMPGFVDSRESDILGLYSAGQLLCADGTMAPPRGVANSSSCNNHGGYISVFDNNGNYVNNAITDTMLDNLQPGDLIYIAGEASNPDAEEAVGAPRQNVTHVVIWTGEKIGASLLISESMIAPETDTDVYGSSHEECSNEWWAVNNNIGNWIITDSHYQGPDFRAFTNCFYRNQVWGVRRVLGSSQ